MPEDNSNESIKVKNYIEKRKKLSGFFIERALPNEYLVQIGKKNIKPILGGKKFKLFKRFLRIPAFVQTLYFKTDNANVDYQGIGIEGYASWRIDPETPEKAINALNFYNEDDPMADTNNQLRTICIEAVRHVIANMNIDDALKKKDEIGENLKNQLKSIEEKWGIIFDEVGIEKVVIMSNKLFEELQSQYRDKLRLDVAKTKITTDKQIAAEQNLMREKTELERLETEKKIEMANLANETFIKESKLEEERRVSQKEREIRKKEYSEEYELRVEEEKKEHEISLLKNNLEIKLQEIRLKLLNASNLCEEIQSDISLKQLEIDKVSKQIQQMHSSEELVKTFISQLPDLFSYINIDNYSVMDYNGNGNISPISKVLTELMNIVKNSDLKWIFDKNKNTEFEKPLKDKEEKK